MVCMSLCVCACVYVPVPCHGAHVEVTGPLMGDPFSPSTV